MNNMKKIIPYILTILLIIIPSNSFAYSNSTNLVIEEIMNNESISDEAKEWLTWFNSLSAENQHYINYRPSELSGYKYEKESYQVSILNTYNTSFNPNTDLSLTGNITDDLGNKILPIGGYEIKYNPTYWNTNRLRANCYTYALNYLATTNMMTQQPGYASGKAITKTTMTKTNIVNAAIKDVNYLSNVKGFRAAGENEKPGYREYKVALVIAPGVDYHWYKQDSDGYWSHKPGSTNVTRADSSGRSIINPRLAYRNYSYANYSTFAGFYFVKY